MRASIAGSVEKCDMSEPLEEKERADMLVWHERVIAMENKAFQSWMKC